MKHLFSAMLILLALAACNTNSPNNHNPTATTAAKTDTLCYESRYGQEVFSLMLILEPDNKVSGTLNYIFPEKPSAMGTFKGTRRGDYIQADYTFVIEGNEQTEVIELEMEPKRIMRKIGPLIEKDGKLVLQDPANSTFGEEFKLINCANAAKN